MLGVRPMRRCLVILCLVIAKLFTVATPVLSADREHQQIMADIRILQEQTVRLQRLMTTLDGSIQQLSTKIDEQTDGIRRAFADNQILMDTLASDVRILREKLDDTNVRISSLSQEVEALRVMTRPAQIPFTQLLIDPETGLPIEGATEETMPIARPLSLGVSPKRMYDTAWADYTNGQWALAIQGFEAYIKTFPRSELSDDAQFYIGQTHYADGQFKEAVKAFEEVVLNHPDGDAVPEASYKRGLSLDRLGETDRARQAFELVVTNYSDSAMATLAQQALDRLDQPER